MKITFDSLKEKVDSTYQPLEVEVGDQLVTFPNAARQDKSWRDRFSELADRIFEKDTVVDENGEETEVERDENEMVSHVIETLEFACNSGNFHILKDALQRDGFMWLQLYLEYIQSTRAGEA